MNYYWIVFIALALISYIVQQRLNSIMSSASKVGIAHGLCGKDVAELMLSQNGVTGVKVRCIDGLLTDHYDPTTKTISLSRDIYNGNNVAAAAVAAHETGHAIQHAMGYQPLKMRSKLVPVVSFSSKLLSWILLAGIILIELVPGILLAGICLFAVTTLFSFITLPVELNASQRALNWLGKTGIVARKDEQTAEKALRSAAYTYVVAAISSLATLIYYILIFMGRRD